MRIEISGYIVAVHKETRYLAGKMHRQVAAPQQRRSLWQSIPSMAHGRPLREFTGDPAGQRQITSIWNSDLGAITQERILMFEETVELPLLEEKLVHYNNKQ